MKQQVSHWLALGSLGISVFLLAQIFQQSQNKILVRLMEKNFGTLSTNVPLTCSSTRRFGCGIVNCILDAPPKRLYPNFGRIVSDCVFKNSRISNASFTDLHMGRFKEKKKFLIPNDFGKNWKSPQCNWLTIGIGGDTKVEKEMAKNYPSACRIYGIEANPAQAMDFADFGTVIPVAVGLKLENLSMTLLTSKGYHRTPVQVHPLHNVIFYCKFPYLISFLNIFFTPEEAIFLIFCHLRNL